MSPALQYLTLSSEEIAALHETGARTIALQAPEGLKRHLFRVAKQLRAEGFSVCISGDPCYGACDLCLETKAMADVLLHFGHAPVDDTPGVIYHFAPASPDPAGVKNALPLLEDTTIGLVTTVQHVHLLEEVKRVLAENGIIGVVCDGSERTPLHGQVLGCSFEAARKTGAHEILFFGTGVFHPIGISLATGARVIACDPYTGRCEIADGDALLRRRFVQIEKARAAESVGILLSLKSGQKREELAYELAALSENAVVITMQEITPDALLNLGFDAYVNTACPRLAYDDQVRFPVPVLSPQEFEIVCGKRTWDDYAIDEIL